MQQKGSKIFALLMEVGGNIYITISKQYPSVDVRQFWKHHSKNEVLPTRCGVPLRIPQYEAIKKSLEQLLEIYPTLEDAQPCLPKNRPPEIPRLASVR